MSAHQLKIKEESENFFEVYFAGELRSGKDLSSESFEGLLKKIRKEAQGKIIVINIDNLRFWDTEGMGKILKLVKDINFSEPNRAVVIGSTNSKNFVRAKEKHKVATSQIPWYENMDLFLEQIGL